MDFAVQDPPKRPRARAALKSLEHGLHLIWSDLVANLGFVAGARQIGPSMPSACVSMRRVVVSNNDSGLPGQRSDARNDSCAKRVSASSLVVTTSTVGKPT